MEHVHLSLIANAEQWETLRKALLSFSHSHQLTKRDEYNLLLICEEWFFNIVNHGFPSSHTIEQNGSYIDVIVNGQSGQCIEIKFTDEGIPFNPFHNQVNEKVSASIEQQLGGLGLYFIIKLLTRYDYIYENNKNNTTMYYGIEQKEN